MQPSPLLAILVVAAVLSLGCIKTAPPAVMPEDTSASAISPPTQPPQSIQGTPVQSNPSAATTARAPYTGGFIDAHAHIRLSSMPYPEILRLMNENNISRTIVMEPPGDLWISKTPSSSYGVPDAATQYPDRFLVLYSGEAGAMLYEAAKSGKYTPAQEQKFLSLLDQAMGSGKYRGIGEIGLRHQPPPGMPASYDITVPADHPWMFIMSDIAAKYHAPLDLHLQAGDTDIAAFERLLDHNKNTTIIWDHAGDHTQNVNPDTLRPLFEAHKNLYTTIKIRTKERQPQGGIMTKEGTISEKWRALIADYPDRFMIGTDVKYGIRSEDPASIAPHHALLAQLPPDLAQRVAQDNPKKIFGIS